MTRQETMVRLGRMIADDYATGWLIGVWFVLPFVLVAFTVQSFLGWTFNISLLVALAVAAPIAVTRSLHVARPYTARERIEVALRPLLPRADLRAAVVGDFAERYTSDVEPERIMAVVGTVMVVNFIFAVTTLGMISPFVSFLVALCFLGGLVAVLCILYVWFSWWLLALLVVPAVGLLIGSFLSVWSLLASLQSHSVHSIQASKGSVPHEL